MSNTGRIRVDYTSVELTLTCLGLLFIGWPIGFSILTLEQPGKSTWTIPVFFFFFLSPWLLYLAAFLVNTLIMPLVDRLVLHQNRYNEGVRRQLEIELRADKYYRLLRHLGP